MLLQKYPELEKPIYCAKKMSLLEKWRDIQFHKNLWKVDERMLREQIMEDGLAEGLAQGLEKGLAKGRAEAQAEKLEVARKLKERGHPAAEIIEVTGLSQETIEKL
uniref:Transposase n=1 Tax=uncultured bacterium contig00051 TaxID=1181535 RepID=A0A806K2U1_9BACT|nr:hypothetical protein [uncultured bacterium contig00051]